MAIRSGCLPVIEPGKIDRLCCALKILSNHANKDTRKVTASTCPSVVAEYQVVELPWQSMSAFLLTHSST